MRLDALLLTASRGTRLASSIGDGRIHDDHPEHKEPR
jgi:hypothetical protein